MSKKLPPEELRERHRLYQRNYYIAKRDGVLIERTDGFTEMEVEWQGRRWKRIEGYSKYYLSEMGEVVSFKSGSPRLLKPCLRPDGYLQVFLFHNDKRDTHILHRLVLEVWERKREDGECCRHLDGNKTNNALTNLTWGTPAENIADEYRHGTFAFGERHGKHKLTVSQVQTIRIMAKRHSAGYVAEQFGVTNHAVLAIMKGETWKHLPVLATE